MADDTEQSERAGGQALKPAAENPWYVLATIWGPFDTREPHLLDRNRVAWNRWMAPAVDAVLAEKLLARGFSREHLAPLEDVERLELQREAGRRGVSLPEPGSPGDPTPVIMSGCHFDGPVVADGFVFPGRAEISHSYFADFASFSNGFFADTVVFADSCFGQEGVFTGTYFNSVDFRACRFEKVADFQKARFRWCRFEGANFGRDTDFVGAYFVKRARFNRTRFAGDARFGDCCFEGRAEFPEASFGKLAGFRGCLFEGPTTFSEACFRGRIDFGQQKFEAATNFEKTTFRTTPNFRDRAFPHAISWRHVSWPTPPHGSDQAAEAEERYAALRYAMEQTGRYEHARDFLALELDCRRVHAPWPTKLAIAAYQALSDVGRSVARPLGAWAIALFVSFALHLGAFAWPSWPTSSLLTETTKLALASAVVVGSPIFDPLRLERIEHRLAIAAGRCPERSETGSCLLPIPFALQLLELLQAAFSALCLFLAGLGLRNWLRIR